MCVPPPRRLHLPCDPLAAANHLMGLVPKLIVSQPFPVPGQAVSAAAPRGAPRTPGMLWEGLSVPRDGVKGWELGRSWAKLLEKLRGGSSHLPRVGFLQHQSRHGRGTGSPLLRHPKRWGSSISPLEGRILPCHGTTRLHFSFGAVKGCLTCPSLIAGCSLVAAVPSRGHFPACPCSPRCRGTRGLPRPRPPARRQRSKN